MDNKSLQELINEVKNRGGGMILNMQDKPEVVVLSIDRYNMLLSGAAVNLATGSEPGQQFLKSAVLPHKGKKILVTGGAGYIGAHVVRRLIAQNHEVVVLDNLSSGKRENVPPPVKFVEGDLADVNLLRDLFAAEQFELVIHMAASLEVEESVSKPVEYLENNAINTERLLKVMAEAGVTNIIFSSTAAVYGNAAENPIPETAPLRPNNPYGYSKLMAERFIKYYCHFSGFRAVVLRYFNACGSDFDGIISSAHQSHLIPIVLEVAAGKRPYLVVNGKDYQTVDGSCVRDYVHVLDIARAHSLAVDYLDEHSPAAMRSRPQPDALSPEGENDREASYRIYNIGTGRGSSVCEIINKASEVLGHIIPMEVGPRRAGDAEASVADNAKIRRELGFAAEYSDLETIIKTSWNLLKHS